jgi:ATP-dependent DNA helicase RecQ
MDELRALIANIWGYRQLRPLQPEAMQAVLDGRDSLVVLPTGSGKSLCYQAPAVYLDGITVVISPLIALMKDQVDSLREYGITALTYHSHMTEAEWHQARAWIRSGQARLIYVSPERMASESFQRYLQSLPVRCFAVDEAHCISHWGHDFRTDYRNLTQLRTLFPGVSIHALTATATRRVREDIINQLNLHAPVVLVGEFDRPNLTYRVIPRQRPFLPQVREVLDRHRGEAGIIYCPRRNDVDELTGKLQRLGYRAIGYHAGMMAQERRTAQEQFINKECDIVVATIAFGMGINRSDIRFVLHTSMPRSIEAYQQETGRAGRDGLEAECVLLNHPQDYVRLKSMLESPRDGRPPNPQYLAEQLRQLADMSSYCRSTRCRHRMLVEYFGQAYDRANCYACDICLGGCEPDPEAKLTSQKVLSAVARLKEHASWANVLDLLRGQATEALLAYNYHGLPTFGILSDQPPSRIEDWLHQLIARGALAKEGELLILNENSRKILYADESVGLLRPPGKRPLRS